MRSADQSKRLLIFSFLLFLFSLFSVFFRLLGLRKAYNIVSLAIALLPATFGYNDRRCCNRARFQSASALHSTDGLPCWSSSVPYLRRSLSVPEGVLAACLSTIHHATRRATAYQTGSRKRNAGTRALLPFHRPTIYLLFRFHNQTKVQRNRDAVLAYHYRSHQCIKSVSCKKRSIACLASPFQ